MPSTQSIRTPNAPEIYSAVVSNFRSAFKARHQQEALLSPQQILEAWEAGWGFEDEDEETLLTMHEWHKAAQANGDSAP
jgi:hypothetical protein